MNVCDSFLDLLSVNSGRCVDAEAQQLAAVRWLTEFLDFAPDAVIPYTPYLVSGILPSLGHHVEALQFASIRFNTLLFGLIHNLPSPDEASLVSNATRTEHNEIIVTIKPHNETDAFDYLAAVSSLTALFVDEHEEARLAALKWLMMLHQKTPKMVC
jgi:vacuole morphology and inheritance protein 14